MYYGQASGLVQEPAVHMKQNKLVADKLKEQSSQDQWCFCMQQEDNKTCSNPPLHHYR